VPVMHEVVGGGYWFPGRNDLKLSWKWDRCRALVRGAPPLRQGLATVPRLFAHSVPVCLYRKHSLQPPQHDHASTFVVGFRVSVEWSRVKFRKKRAPGEASKGTGGQALTRGLHSFQSQLNLRSSVHRMAKLNS
jgi:hypothetical protein